VWHASVTAHRITVPVDVLRRTAHAELDGVGEPALGEWEAVNGRFLHLRRRLSDAEQQTVGPAVDIRGTWEATKRRERVARWLPPGYPEEVPA
jgi:hypothetical protein